MVRRRAWIPMEGDAPQVLAESIDGRRPIPGCQQGRRGTMRAADGFHGIGRGRRR